MRIFIAWITLQLILIGMVSVSITNDVVNKKYNCTREVSPEFVGALFPLVAFVPENPAVREYCHR